MGLVIMFVLGVMLIAMGIFGNPGSLLGALLAPEGMQ